MGSFPEDVMRIINTITLPVNSQSGAVVSTTSVGAETYAVDLVFNALAINTTGIRYAISSPNDAAVTSTSGALLPANWIQRHKITPGQKVQAISADNSAQASFTIIELSK